MTTYTQKIGELYDKAENPVDRAFFAGLISLDNWWYKTTNLGMAAWLKYYAALVLAFLRLRPPVNKELDFPELDWDLDL